MSIAVDPGPDDPQAQVIALRLDRLTPERDLDAEAVTRDAVALLTALEGQRDARFVLQTVCHPQVEAPEHGRIDIALIAVVVGSEGAPPTEERLLELSDDLLDLFSAPPLRWSFSPVEDVAELERVLNPLEPGHLAEIVRREEPAQPNRWMSGAVGFGEVALGRRIDRPLWTMWTLGPAAPDLRRLASVLLAQEAPLCIRTTLVPTELTEAERHEIEELVVEVGPALNEGLLRSSLRTIESLLYLRPLFDTRCIVASREPLSAGLLSALGHSISEPAAHGTQQAILSGGFQVLHDGRGAEPGVLEEAWRSLAPGRPVPGLGPPGMERLRRLLGVWEAANVFRIPVTEEDDFPGLRTLQVPDLPPPLAQLPGTGNRLGAVVGYARKPVRLQREERFRHVYVSGQTGTGKSTLLLNQALQDIQSGAGVAVLDPHGDLVEALLERIPDDRIDDVVLVDPADPVAVVGVNLLEAESAVQAEYVVAELCNMFYDLFDPRRQGIIGPRYETWLRQAALLLLANPDTPSSFLDISTVFVDDAVRDHLLEGIDDPILHEFWIGEMGQTSAHHKSEVLGWFRSKFEVFRTSQLVRNVVGQARSTVSFPDILNNRRILLVNLSKGLLGNYNSALLGHIVFARLWSAALERAAMAPEDRADFFVYVDEFQNATSESLPDVLSESRKFRLGLTLANQFFTQVPERIRDAIMGNVGSRLTFRLGPKDGPPFASWLGRDVEADDLTTLPNFVAVAALTNRGVPLEPFPLRADPPPPEGDPSRAEQVRARSREQWGRPVELLDEEFFGRWGHIKGSISEQTGHGRPEHRRAAPTGSRFLDEWLAGCRAVGGRPC